MYKLLLSRKASEHPLVSTSGFTMIELLMVIILVGILGGVALPQFLDFRQAARVAAAEGVVQSVVMGIKLQHKQAILRCGMNPQAQIPLSSIELNDVTAGVGAVCTTAQIPDEADRKFFDGPIGLFPINPVTKLRTIGSPAILNPGETYAENGTCSASSEGTSYGWCYDPTTEDFFSANDSTGGGRVEETSGELTGGGSESSGSGGSSTVGCMSHGYDNYNAVATSDDGSCACTGDRSFSYNVYACVDNVPGCTDANMDNYNPSATVDDGSCACDSGRTWMGMGCYPEGSVLGCTTPGYDNYDPSATLSYGQCTCSSGKIFDGSTCVACAPGTVASNNSCVACGGVGQPCCSGNVCTGGYCSPYGAQYGLQTSYVCTSGVTGVDRCDNASQCQSGYCNRAQDTCSTGAAGQNCNWDSFSQCQSGRCSNNGNGLITGVCL